CVLHIFTAYPWMRFFPTPWEILPPGKGVLPSSAPTSGDSTKSVQAHCTPGRAYPLVLAFHGRGTTANWMARRTHLNRVADEQHFLVVYPDGYKGQWGDGRGQTPAEREGVDDVAFIATL